MAEQIERRRAGRKETLSPMVAMMLRRQQGHSMTLSARLWTITGFGAMCAGVVGWTMLFAHLLFWII